MAINKSLFFRFTIKQDMWNRKEIQNIKFREKNITKKFNIGALVCAGRDNKIKEKPELK